MEDVVFSIDIESTGFSTTKDRIVEIAVVRHNSVTPKDEKKSDSVVVSHTKNERKSDSMFWRRVNPGIAIPAATTAIHHISDEDVANCPTFDQIAPDLLKFIYSDNKGKVGQIYLVGHNLLRFDLPMLQCELLRAKQPPLDLSKIQCIDTLVIFRKQEPHTLSKALEFYCQKPLTGAHSAQNDAQAALDVFLAQKHKYQQSIGMSNAQYAQHSHSSNSFSKIKSK